MVEVKGQKKAYSKHNKWEDNSKHMANSLENQEGQQDETRDNGKECVRKDFEQVDEIMELSWRQVSAMVLLRYRASLRLRMYAGYAMEKWKDLPITTSLTSKVYYWLGISYNLFLILCFPLSLSPFLYTCVWPCRCTHTCILFAVGKFLKDKRLALLQHSSLC